MDPLTRAVNLEDCAWRWIHDADKFKGRRKKWRLDRASRLFVLAWEIVEKEIHKK